jgi:F420-0:gamma-glutamyl ligase
MVADREAAPSREAGVAIGVRTVGAPAASSTFDLPATASEAGTVVAIPVRTRLIVAGDDLPAIVAGAVRGIARADDVVAVSETAVAIAQGRMVPAEMVRPSRLAYALSQRAGALATVNQPESLQLVIDRVGVWRVLYAGAMHVLGRFAGRRGVFYEVLGDAISAIDGYTGTLPPFERTIVFGPEDPVAVAREVAARAGAYAAIVDVNDLGVAKVLGASTGVLGERVERALRTNPHGNGDEQTPIVVLSWRGNGRTPLAGEPA